MTATEGERGPRIHEVEELTLSRFDNNIAVRVSLESLCDARNRAVHEYEMALGCIKRSESILNGIGSHIFPWEGNQRLSLDEFTKQTDRRLWLHAFDMTGLRQYMDKKATKEFHDGLEKNPPAFTMENCKSNLLNVASQADEFFVRGLVEFFLRLSKLHKTNTNEPFKVNRKAIVGYCASTWCGMTVASGTYSCGSELINDMDRVFKTLDGEKHSAWKESNVYEDEYYRIKGFKNGNIHIEFKRDDLLGKANKLISDYYNGSALARSAA